MSKKRKKKQKAIHPDEVLEAGPVRIARYGNNIVWQGNWAEGQFDEFQKHAIERFPKVIEEIDTLVSEIAGLVKKLPAEKLLHRAWWEMATKHIAIQSEADIGHEEASAMRMIDYVQSSIAAVTPNAEQEKDISEEDWSALHTKIDSLFQKLNHEYQISRTANKKANDQNFDESFEEYEFKAQIFWTNVRGHRYQVHEPVYLRDMFLAHSDVLQELFGISAEQFVEELQKIWHALTFGLGDAMQDLESFRQDSLAALEKKLADDPPEPNADIADIMADVIKENGWEKRRDEVIGRAFLMDLFDLQKVTTLPRALLDELSWSPGQETEFFADGDFKGWPLRIWPIFKRPFIKLGDRHYCFDIYSLFDNIYRVIQRVIVRLKPDYKETWNKIQQQISEQLPFKYLETILPEASRVQPIYYQWQTGAGGAKQWCEADGLLLYDDHLFIVEARGGAFTYTSPATDFPAYVESLRNLVLKPANQGRRFLEYLNSAETVALFDKDHKEIGKLRRADFRHVTICAVTIDPFTELAAQVQHLRNIGVDVGDQPVWVCSVDDLRVYADIFENPLTFLHFVEQRLRAFKSDVVELDDEIDYVGLYLKHNNFSMYADAMHAKAKAEIRFHGYRSDVDKFFSKRLFDPDEACLLKQDIPARYLEIVEFLAASDKASRTELSSYLLDIAFDWRANLSEAIENDLKVQVEIGRPKPFSTHGNVNLTAYCWTEALPRDAGGALEHARTVALLNNDNDRILVELMYSNEGKLVDVHWQKIGFEGLSEAQMTALKDKAEQLRQKRFASARAARRKIGRNDLCPCGSGKKYKKCCLNK